MGYSFAVCRLMVSDIGWGAQVLVPYEASENSEKTVFKPIPRVDYGYSKSNTRHSRSRYE